MDFDFQLDDFQLDAIKTIEANKSVLVAAPTGSGKTVVALFAIGHFLEKGLRTFYTSPIKALANQKYRDLCGQFGEDTVGLLTGDVSIRPHAKVVVMTTEVLRNMCYDRGAEILSDRALRSLGCVVLDEVHYLQDRFRGPVWEEVLLNLPSRVLTVSLSATVSNLSEFLAWLRKERGPTELVLAKKRPVPLDHLMAGFDKKDKAVKIFPLYKNGRRYSGIRQRSWQDRSERALPRYSAPRRRELVEELVKRGDSPIIWFVFSRAKCDEAALDFLDDGLCFTTAEQRERIRTIIDKATEVIPDQDWFALGMDEWALALTNGIATHHAGMIPAAKEVVETCFEEGLISVVFATETLALGVNLPARTVVLEKLIKYDGENHKFLTPLQYTQLAGRAGRRGIDKRGSAVICFDRRDRIEQVLALVSSNEYPMNSAFVPNYNMVVNLFRRNNEAQCKEFIKRSFAQFQTSARDPFAKRISQLKAEIAELEKTTLTTPHNAAGKIKTRDGFHSSDEEALLFETRRLQSKLAKLQRRQQKTQLALIAQFEGVLAVLKDRSFIDGQELTEKGRLLASINTESDVALIEAASAGLFAKLNGPELASVLCALVYEQRFSAEPPRFQWPNHKVRHAIADLSQICDQLLALETTNRLSNRTVRPDPGLSYSLYRWALGDPLVDVIGTTMPGGDFVRLVKRLIDILRQLAALGDENLASAAFEATVCIDRGVVRSARLFEEVQNESDQQDIDEVALKTQSQQTELSSELLDEVCFDDDCFDDDCYEI